MNVELTGERRVMNQTIMKWCYGDALTQGPVMANVLYRCKSKDELLL